MKCWVLLILSHILQHKHIHSSALTKTLFHLCQHLCVDKISWKIWNTKKNHISFYTKKFFDKWISQLICTMCDCYLWACKPSHDHWIFSNHLLTVVVLMMVKSNIEPILMASLFFALFRSAWACSYAGSLACSELTLNLNALEHSKLELKCCSLCG